MMSTTTAAVIQGPAWTACAAAITCSVSAVLDRLFPGEGRVDMAVPRNRSSYGDDYREAVDPIDREYERRRFDGRRRRARLILVGRLSLQGM